MDILHGFCQKQCAAYQTMPDLIQFECPSCAATLRIPIESSGQQGPCPVCHHEIVAPDPYTGIGAYLAMATLAPSAPPPSPEELPAFADPLPEPAQPAPIVPAAPPEPALPIPAVSTVNQPFPDRLISSTPLPEAQESGFTPVPQIQDPIPAPRKSRKGIIFLALFSTAMLALAAGLFIGNRLRPDPGSAPFVIQPKPVPKVSPAEAPPVSPPAIPTVPEKPPESTPPPEPKKIITAAEATLRAFLEAPDWASRSAYILSPESVRPKMEAYAKDNPDGPTPFESFSVKHSQVDEKSGSTLFVFQVDSPNTAGGIPVAILETSKGWLVDWESFVEFRDDQFKHFTEGPADLKGEFHLIVTAPPQDTAQENENFAGFILSPPLPDRQRTAFVKKSSPAYARLREATENGRVFTPVLEIVKRNAGDKQSYLEIVSIKASDWRPKEK